MPRCAMKSTAEMMAPVYAIRNRMAMIGAALLALVGVQAFSLPARSPAPSTCFG
jgi:hypothetical protein